MSTGKSPFVIVYGYSPCTLIDLVPLPPNAQISKAVEILPNTSMTYMLRLEGKLQRVMLTINLLLMYIVGLGNLTKVTMSWFIFTLSASLNILLRNYMLGLGFENLNLMLAYSTYIII